MTGGAFIIWLHGLAALLFCGAAIVEARRPSRFVGHLLLLAALGITALWALGVAGIGDGEMPVRVALTLRNLAWLAVLSALSRRTLRHVRGRQGAFVAAAGCAALAGVVAITLANLQTNAARAAAEMTWLVLRLLSTIAALVLLHHHASASAKRRSGGETMLVAAIGLMWSTDLLVLVFAYAAGSWSEWLTALRGVVTVVVALAVTIALQREGDRSLSVSRTATAQAILLLGAMLYVAAAIGVTGALGQVGGAHARVIQTAFVFGSGAALLTFLTTPWLRAWAKVMVAKHLFSHRYDYRAEWMRFTDTLGISGDDVSALPNRVVQAVADLTASPAGLLLLAERDGMVAGPAWRWDEAPAIAATMALTDYLARTARIIDLDSCRVGEAPAAEIASLPEWLVARAEAWAVVPLLRADTLIGAIVLARPPLTRALDWEDFDLLGAAGRQAASYLAEERAHAALTDAQRFDEFNRRFAFIMHDLKNLVSQTALVSRNAERHADNPAFRADMIATLRDTSQRMTGLLARLSHHQLTAGDAVQPVELLTLVKRLAEARRTQHVVRVSGGEAIALADAAALETLLGHLVQNAIEATQSDAAVELHVESIAGGAAAGEAVVTVVDHGCGMTPAFVRDQLFRPFVSDKAGGFGLGAFEARQMVEKMGGSITVTTRVGEGSSFRVTLPLAPALEQAA